MKQRKDNKINKNDDNIMEKDTMKLFTMLSEYFVLVLIIFSLLQFINCINFGVIQIISIISPIIIYLIKNSIDSIKKKTIILLIYLFMIIVLPFIYTKTYDLSVDGNSYHKTAIAFLKNGWNPIYETARDFQKNNKNIIPIKKEHRQDLWMEHYPKATWIISASMYQMTGSIESGKCITIILSIMLLIISYNCLKKIIDKKWSILISIILTLNPVFLAQLFTYYVDGIMGICFAIELLLLINIDVNKKIDKNIIINLIAICSIFVNLKFTGLMYSGIIAAVYYFYWLIENRKNNIQDVFKRLTIMFILIFVPAIFIIGSNSYVQNTIEHKNPLYPLVGKDKVDIITTIQPKNFEGKSRIKKFIISTLSKTEMVTNEGYTTLKLPFMVYKDEITALYSPDTRVAAFGPFTALITIISLFLLVILLIILYKKEKTNIKYLLLPLITIIISTIMVGENWWARYVPQLYFIPVGVIAITLYLRKYLKTKKIIIITCVLLFVIFLNTSCFIYVESRLAISFISIYKDIIEMKKIKDLNIRLSGNDDLYGYYYTLNDYGVKYKINNDIPDNKMEYKYNWRIVIENNEKNS